METSRTFSNVLEQFQKKRKDLVANIIISNISANVDTLPRSDTASYTSMNSPTPSSVTTNGGGGGSGTTNFDIDFNESILQVHKRSPLYIIGDRSQHRVRDFVFEMNIWIIKLCFRLVVLNNFKIIVFFHLNFMMLVK